MIKDFDDIEASVKEFVNVQESGEVYSGRYLLRMFQIVSEMCATFVNHYENKYLASTHWRIIKIKDIKDVSIRNGLSIICYLFDNDKKQIEKATEISVDERILKDKLDSIETKYKLLIEHLKYDFINDELIVGAHYVNLVLNTVFDIYYIDSLNQTQVITFQSIQSLLAQLAQKAARDKTKLMELVGVYRHTVFRIFSNEENATSEDINTNDQG